MNIQLLLRQYNVNFVTYELCLGIYSIKDFSEAVYTMGDHEGTLKIENADISMETKFYLPRFRGTFGTCRFDEKSFNNVLLGFTPFWDKKPTNAIHAGSASVYTTDKILYLSTIGKTHLKCDSLMVRW